MWDGLGLGELEVAISADLEGTSLSGQPRRSSQQSRLGQLLVIHPSQKWCTSTTRAPAIAYWGAPVIGHHRLSPKQLAISAGLPRRPGIGARHLKFTNFSVGMVPVRIGPPRRRPLLRLFAELHLSCSPNNRKADAPLAHCPKTAGIDARVWQKASMPPGGGARNAGAAAAAARRAACALHSNPAAGLCGPTRVMFGADWAKNLRAAPRTRLIAPPTCGVLLNR